MGLFGKKSSDAEAMEDKEIKDLRPENKRLRKEPVKPWGKFERYVVLFAIIITVVTAIVLMLYASGFRLPEVGINIPDFNIFESQTIMIPSQ